eukprot:9936000-Prorocentrum_lima.AAC.1
MGVEAAWTVALYLSTHACRTASLRNWTVHAMPVVLQWLTSTLATIAPNSFARILALGTNSAQARAN